MREISTKKEGKQKGTCVLFSECQMGKRSDFILTFLVDGKSSARGISGKWKDPLGVSTLEAALLEGVMPAPRLRPGSGYVLHGQINNPHAATGSVTGFCAPIAEEINAIEGLVRKSLVPANLMHASKAVLHKNPELKCPGWTINTCKCLHGGLL